MRFSLLFMTALQISSAVAQGNGYKVAFDLTSVKDDQLPVMIQTPEITEDQVEFHMAKIVPGTYSISDFGRFVTDFVALTAEGDTLISRKIDTNRWVIDGADQLSTLRYHVHDTFDRFDGYGSNYIFEPGGTNLEPENQVFVLNTFGLIGYLQGYKFRPYQLSIKHSKEISGATALQAVSISDSLDTYEAQDFNFLADGPLMYCPPDIATKQLANAEVVVSVYSPNGMLTATEVMEKISDLMEAQRLYLGGELPVDRYAYLIYLLDSNTLSGKMGALEHSYSSVYTLPEANADQIGQTVRDVAAHEFFHIVTPLNIHSEQIGNFDYINPKMSKHLWLYEGCTEYAAMHVQVKYGLYDRERFLQEIKQKIQVRSKFPTDVPFTTMSQEILGPKYEPMYTNVYYKGALIGMSMDLLLLKLSDGSYDLQALLRDLAAQYGPQRSFSDDELFSDIEKLTYPEVRAFLDEYVAGKKPLPLEEVLSWAGVIYKEEEEVEDFTLGQIGLAMGDDNDIVISNVSQMNAFGQAMGYMKGDILLEFQGQKVDITTINGILDTYKDGLEEGDKIKIKVQRRVKGKEKRRTLKAKAITIKKKLTDVIRFTPDPTEAQMAVREAWLSGKI
ncbi:MAG: peptidase M61 [Bacteroidota bacterium]